MATQERRIGAYGVCEQNGCLLVIRKAKGPYTGRFDLPGGGIEFGETPEETLVREFLEETGLAVTAGASLGAFSKVVTFVSDTGRGEIELHHMGFLYRAVPVSAGAPVRDEPDGLDSLGALWVPIAELTADLISPLVARGLALITG